MDLKKIVFPYIFLIFCTTSSFSASDETYDKLKLMIDIMEVIDTNYVSEIDPKTLAIGAIKGVVAALDPFSQYMEKKVYKEMQNETEGVYSGIGIHIMIKNDFITVVSPLPETPAYRAGVLPEDKIIKINDKSTISMSQNEAVRLMRGKAGKKVKLTILRDTIGEIEFNLVREKIKIEVVKATMLDDNIAYVRLTEFNQQSLDDVKKALEDCEKQGMKTLIFDLRNNPGGLLDSAINIISLFIEDKKLALTTKGRVESSKREYFTNGNGKFSNLPLIILVNRGSASASEIMSGALQDFKRALVIGTNTFGKGSVQTVIPLQDGTALMLTIAKYYLPSGRPISRLNKNKANNGITPDVEIKVTMEEEIKLYMQGDTIFEKDKNIKSEFEKKNKPADQKTEAEMEDNVLNKAVRIIKENKITDMINTSKALNNSKDKKYKKK